MCVEVEINEDDADYDNDDGLRIYEGESKGCVTCIMQLHAESKIKIYNIYLISFKLPLIFKYF